MLDQLKAHVGRAPKRDRRMSFVSRQSATEAGVLAPCLCGSEVLK